MNSSRWNSLLLVMSTGRRCCLLSQQFYWWIENCTCTSWLDGEQMSLMSYITFTDATLNSSHKSSLFMRHLRCCRVCSNMINVFELWRCWRSRATRSLEEKKWFLQWTELPFLMFSAVQAWICSEHISQHWNGLRTLSLSWSSSAVTNCSSSPGSINTYVSASPYNALRPDRLWTTICTHPQTHQILHSSSF